MLDQENKEKQPIHSIPIGYVFKLNRNVFIPRIPKKKKKKIIHFYLTIQNNS